MGRNYCIIDTILQIQINKATYFVVVSSPSFVVDSASEGSTVGSSEMSSAREGSSVTVAWLLVLKRS